jgi:hypothetical protein
MMEYTPGFLLTLKKLKGKAETHLELIELLHVLGLREKAFEAWKGKS